MDIQLFDQKLVFFSVLKLLLCWESQRKVKLFSTFSKILIKFSRKKMSKIVSKPNFLVTFLSSTSRNRMWTYNFLTKSECFSTFSSFYWLGKANEKLSFFQHFLTFSSNFLEKNVENSENVGKSLQKLFVVFSKTIEA